jgi:hypothetical protein
VSEPTPPAWNAASSGSAEPGPAPAVPEDSAPVQAQPTPAGPTPAGPLPATPPGAGSSRAGKISGGAVAVALSALVAVGGLGFAVGRVTAPTTTNGFANDRFGNGTGQFPGSDNGGAPGGVFGRGGFGGFTISGTVTNATADQLTVKTASGTEVTIPLDSSTAYHSQAAASSADVAAGVQVQVQVQPQRTAAGQGGQGTTPTLGPATAVTIVGN